MVVVVQCLSSPVGSVGPVGPDDYFEETETSSPWSVEPTITTKLRKDFLNELRTGPVAGTNDLDAAIALTHLVWDDLIAFGTGGGNTLDDKELALTQRTLTEVLSRIGINIDLPVAGLQHFQGALVAQRLLGLVAGPPRPPQRAVRPCPGGTGSAGGRPVSGRERRGGVAAHQDGLAEGG